MQAPGAGARAAGQPGEAWALPMPVAMGAVGLNAVVAGLSAGGALSWALVPGVAAGLARAHVAGWVSTSAVLLAVLPAWVELSAADRAEAQSWIAAGVFLAVMPLLARARQQGGPEAPSGPSRNRARWPLGSLRAEPGSVQGAGVRPVVMLAAGTSGEVAAATTRPDGGLRMLLGAVAGQVQDPRALARAVEAAFQAVAHGPDVGLVQVGAHLDEVVRRLAPEGYVAATVVDVGVSGRVRVLRCGGPPIYGLPCTDPDADTVTAATTAAAPTGVPERVCLVDAGPGGPPLGLALGLAPVGSQPVLPAAARVRWLPAHARIAIVTTAHALAHHDQPAVALERALVCESIEAAAVELLYGPVDARGGMDVVGPSAVLEALPARRSSLHRAG